MYDFAHICAIVCKQVCPLNIGFAMTYNDSA